ncbi:transcriptional regulator with GAF, ATPase, and Fis domain [Methylorubrum extorquens]|nr:transcriptional regulator with GAF, ATPase, and Fis domain [Methylorubrum extorquens]
MIEDALKASGQRIAEAARTLGLPRKTLSDRMRRLGLSAGD